MRLVFNASPLIASAKAGFMPLWERHFPGFRVPVAVFREVCAVADASDPAKRWLEGSKEKDLVLKVPDIPPPIQAWDLGAGESEVLAAVRQLPDGWAVLDDLAARRCAGSLGIPVIGTVGLVFKVHEIDPDFDPKGALTSLERAGLYLPRGLLARWLKS